LYAEAPRHWILYGKPGNYMKCALHASVDMLIWKMAFYLSEKTVTILKKKKSIAKY